MLEGDKSEIRNTSTGLFSEASAWICWFTGPRNFLQPSSDGFRQGQLIRKTILPQEPITDIWNLLSVLLLSLWGTKPVTCMFGASNEAGNGLINSPWSSHTSNWESDNETGQRPGNILKVRAHGGNHLLKRLKERSPCQGLKEVGQAGLDLVGQKPYSEVEK